MKVMGRLIGILIKTIIGMVAIYYTNKLFAGFHFDVGLNIFNGLVVGVLGICGFILIYVLAIIDQTL